MPTLILLLAGCQAEVPPEDRTTPAAPSGTTDTETPPREPTCQPDAEPVFVDEGQPVSITVACSGTGIASAFAIDALPPGAAFDPATSILSWTPALDQAGRWRVDGLVNCIIVLQKKVKYNFEPGFRI